jgi:hypothetical protein
MKGSPSKVETMLSIFARQGTKDFDSCGHNDSRKGKGDRDHKHGQGSDIVLLEMHGAIDSPNEANRLATKTGPYIDKSRRKRIESSNTEACL